MERVAKTTMLGIKPVEGNSMPPPKKMLRRGTSEWKAAVNNGEIKLSLPRHQVGSWIDDLPRTLDQSGSSLDHSLKSSSRDEIKKLDTPTKSHCASRSSKRGHTKDDEVQEHHPSPPQHDQNSTPGTNFPLDGTLNESKGTIVSVEHKGKKSMTAQLSTRFSDIIGHGAAKLRLDEVLLPMALPPALADSILTGVRSLSASILLYGPPGCGKTQLAKAIAGESRAAFLTVGPSDILSKFVGESEASIRSLFNKAYERARKMESKCSVLFFDEIDALGQARGAANGDQSSSMGCSRRVLAELLIQLNRINSSSCCNTKSGVAPSDEDMIDSNEENDLIDTVLSEDDESSSCSKFSTSETGRRERVIVVAATNRPEDCDPALVRRFSVRIMVGLPSKRERRKILKRYLTGIEHNISQEQLDWVARSTDGWSGSDLESLTREAAMAPIRECIRSAALLKRRIPQTEQKGGDSSSQDGNSLTYTTHEEANAQLLDKFRNLRQVSLQDFEEAIAFWTGNHRSGGDSGNTTVEQKHTASRHTHYDSSSEEED